MKNIFLLIVLALNLLFPAISYSSPSETAVPPKKDISKAPISSNSEDTSDNCAAMDKDSYSPPEAQNEKESASAAIALLVDKSRSMNKGNTLEKIKTVIVDAIKMINDENVVSITAFDDAPFLVLLPARAKVARPIVSKRLNALSPSGGSDITSSLETMKNTFDVFKSSKKTLIIISDNRLSEPSNPSRERIRKISKQLDAAAIRTVFISVSYKPDSENTFAETLFTDFRNVKTESELKQVVESYILQAQ